MDACSNAHFYRNKLLDNFVLQKPTPITLRQLLFYERTMNADRLLLSANFVRRELPIRISHRIREFQRLPFIVGTNPHIQEVYELYWRAFDRLRKIPVIKSLEDNDAFCEALAESLEAHMVVIPRLALGVSECGAHLQPERIDRFMHATLRSRISRRVLAEQHLALTEQMKQQASAAGSSHDTSHPPISAIFSRCSVKDTVAQCTALVRAHYGDNTRVVVDGDDKDVEFTYIFDHIEYILYQLLANAAEHTAMHHRQSSLPLPPIRVTVCHNQSDVLFRISDQGGGMSADTYNNIWSYGHLPRFTNLRKVSQLAARITEHDQFTMPLGIGLPMSRVYAEYWGGDINLVTMEGWGTDAYVRIPRFGTQNENLDLCSPEDDASLPSAPPSSRRFVV
ncbi:branched-chain alpha-ketoacid dehydrogenase [Dichotomocladium elegans]|nr:branched-chain alpha-ketoacid dehydrogenase [Dichotomocladium elegans]